MTCWSLRFVWSRVVGHVAVLCGLHRSVCCCCDGTVVVYEVYVCALWVVVVSCILLFVVCGPLDQALEVVRAWAALWSSLVVSSGACSLLLCLGCSLAV